GECRVWHVPKWLGGSGHRRKDYASDRDGKHAAASDSHSVRLSSAAQPPQGTTALLSKEHRITEKGMMEFQPFGIEPDGTSIRDLSGVVIRALVEYLEESMSLKHGQEAGRRAVEELVRRLNARIPDRAYYVTAEFLKNLWNSYSNEFGAYLTQFCWDISG